MARASASRTLGDRYQQRLFWLYATRMFNPENHIMEVCFEWDEVLGFDDIVVRYDRPVSDGRGGQITVDYYQSKFHVDNAGDIGFYDLQDPGFIGNTSLSLLGKLKKASDATEALGHAGRFTLVTPWGVRRDDPLSELRSNDTDGIRGDMLLGTKKISQAGESALTSWRDHLELENSEELFAILRSLRLKTNAPTVDGLREHLTDIMPSHGLKTIDATSQLLPYDDLIARLYQSGIQRFDQEKLRDYLSAEGLWVGSFSGQTHVKPIAIRSFSKGLLSVVDHADTVLDLTGDFDGRELLPAKDWETDVSCRVRDYLEAESDGFDGEIELYLDTITSIAFAAGRALRPTRTAIVPIQFSHSGGKQRWDTSGSPDSTVPTWTSEEIEVERGDPGEFAIAISVTRDVCEDVESYIQENQTRVGMIEHFKVSDGVGPKAIRDGNHASMLAHELSEQVAKLRKRRTSGTPLHLFISGPVGFAYYLGRSSNRLGFCQLYEYNFRTSDLGAYTPSISIGGGSKAQLQDAKERIHEK